MRTSSISILSSGAFVALASTAVFAQSPEPAAPVLQDLRTAVDSDSGELTTAGSPWARAAHVDRFAMPQEDDYSVEGMFSELHGKYMVDRKPFDPNFRIWGGYQGKAGLSGENGKFEFYELGAKLDAELPVDPDTFLTYGAYFTMRDYDMDQATGVQDTTLYQTFLTLGIGHFFNEDFLVEAHFQPGFASDFEGTLNRDDWKFFGDVLATYRTNEQLYWKLGVRVDEVFEGTMVYPLFGVSFLVDESFRVDILAPRFAEIAWLPDPALILKAGVSLQGNEYHYRIDVGNNNDEEADWRTQEFRIYGDVAWRLTDQVSLGVRAGATLAGKYDIGRASPAEAYAGQIDPAFFGEVGGGFSF